MSREITNKTNKNKLKKYNKVLDKYTSRCYNKYNKMRDKKKENDNYVRSSISNVR